MRADDWTYGRIYYTATQGIWPRGLRPHAMVAITGRKNDHQNLMGTTGYKYRDTDRHIISSEPHWGTKDPSVGINALRHWTPTLEINTNKKTAKGPRKTGRTYGQIYYTATQGIWTCGMWSHALRASTSCSNEFLLPIQSRLPKKKTDTIYIFLKSSLFSGGLFKNYFKIYNFG